MKKIILSTMLAAAFVVVPTQKSHALVSGGGSSFTVTSALYLAGGVGTIVGTVEGVKRLKRNVSNKYGRAGANVLMVLGIMVGVILMDDDGQLSEFKAISPDFSKMIQSDIEAVTAEDISIYNSEVEELNSILSNIEAEESRGDGELTQDDILAGLEEYDIDAATIKVAGVLSALTMEK